ncbi:hypothetical protein H0H92_013130 [Tricholoma furcatifolium]|nr:hypothetical protein H0H92_013130 [Tricholoma furcatifolium]
MTILVSLALAISAFAFVAHGQQDGLLISTPQGPVLGTLVNPSVRQFLGVPYATANRWEAPTLPPLRSTPLSATKFSDSCPQSLTPGAVEFLRLTGADNSIIFVPESENCLTSNIPTYNGQNIVEDNDDILVVTFNYRTNIFGFPNSPQLASNTSQAQNLGLLDLDAAVQWVYDNIAAFGGDPERITIFGQSAGAAAVDAYTFAHPQDTRVKGAIEQSGNVAIITSNLTATFDAWNTVAVVVGCGNVTDAPQLACMKQVPTEQLEAAVISTGASFAPFADGITFFSDTAARASAGDFLHVPLLGGTVENEGDIFVVAAQEVVSNITIPNLTEILADLETQLVFTCPAGAAALDRVNANVSTWRYQYQAVFPDISTRPDLRAYHASEIPVIFGTFISPTATEKELSKFIQGAWVAFARDPAQGLIDLGWPQYSPTTNTLAQIGGFFNETGITLTEGDLIDFTCNSTDTLGVAFVQLAALLGPAGEAAVLA